MAPADVLQLELVWSPEPGCVRHQRLSLAAPVTVAEALASCEAFEADRAQLLALGPLRVGVWGRLRSPDSLLRQGDRIEIYRALTVDPKEARRQRYRATGKRIVSRHRPLAGSEKA